MSKPDRRQRLVLQQTKKTVILLVLVVLFAHVMLFGFCWMFSLMNAKYIAINPDSEMWYVCLVIALYSLILISLIVSAISAIKNVRLPCAICFCIIIFVSAIPFACAFNNGGKFAFMSQTTDIKNYLKVDIEFPADDVEMFPRNVSNALSADYFYRYKSEFWGREVLLKLDISLPDADYAQEKSRLGANYEQAERIIDGTSVIGIEYVGGENEIANKPVNYAYYSTTYFCADENNRIIYFFAHIFRD